MSGTRTRAERIIARLPIVRSIAGHTARWMRRSVFSARDYWQLRYAAGRTSGAGSRGPLARFKAEVLNEFVRERQIRSVLELGCGDGAQLALAEYPRYTGLDIAPAALARSIARFADDRTKSFFLYDPECFVDRAGALRAELALSLDVVYHLVDDRVFELYMRHLFAAGERYVIVYSSDAEDASLAVHVRHRRFTAWVTDRQPAWELVERIPNRYPFTGDLATSSFADFFVYARRRVLRTSSRFL